MTKDEEDRTRPDLLTAWEVAEPPPHFADRVMQKMAKKDAPRGWSTRRLAGLLALMVAAAWLLLRVQTADLGSSGAARVSERQSLALGRRGVAVAEAGAEIEWRVQPGGDARVEQKSGNVFYRVERGGRFVVATATGEVEVTGTCFRVEVDPMSLSKQAMLAAGLGAAGATVTWLSVYEGRVRLSNSHGSVAISAGEHGAASAGAAPERASASRALAAAPMPPPPPDGVTREELLRRDQSQRTELAQLRARLRTLEQARSEESPPRTAENAKGRAFFDPPKEELVEMAKKCELRWDEPPIGLSPYQISPTDAERRGFTEQERLAANQVNVDFNNRVVGELRALYVEVTGDKAGADGLSPNSLMQEIMAKSPDGAISEAYWRISHERAGLMAPGDSKASSPVEGLMRLRSSMGSMYEHDLGAVIGPDRARSLREEHGGWGNRNSSSRSCPQGR